jgi:hypothetical protein
MGKNDNRRSPKMRRKQAQRKKKGRIRKKIEAATGGPKTAKKRATKKAAS